MSSIVRQISERRILPGMLLSIESGELPTGAALGKKEKAFLIHNTPRRWGSHFVHVLDW